MLFLREEDHVSRKEILAQYRRQHGAYDEDALAKYKDFERRRPLRSSAHRSRAIERTLSASAVVLKKRVDATKIDWSAPSVSGDSRDADTGATSQSIGTTHDDVGAGGATSGDSSNSSSSGGGSAALPVAPAMSGSASSPFSNTEVRTSTPDDTNSKNQLPSPPSSPPASTPAANSSSPVTSSNPGKNDALQPPVLAFSSFKKGVTKDNVAGIVVGTLFMIAILVGIGYFILQYRRKTTGIVPSNGHRFGIKKKIRRRSRKQSQVLGSTDDLGQMGHDGGTAPRAIDTYPYLDVKVQLSDLTQSLDENRSENDSKFADNYFQSLTDEAGGGVEHKKENDTYEFHSDSNLRLNHSASLDSISEAQEPRSTVTTCFGLPMTTFAGADSSMMWPSHPPPALSFSPNHKVERRISRPLTSPGRMSTFSSTFSTESSPSNSKKNSLMMASLTDPLSCSPAGKRRLGKFRDSAVQMTKHGSTLVIRDRPGTASLRRPLSGAVGSLLLRPRTSGGEGNRSSAAGDSADAIFIDTDDMVSKAGEDHLVPFGRHHQQSSTAGADTSGKSPTKHASTMVSPRDSQYLEVGGGTGVSASHRSLPLEQEAQAEEIMQRTEKGCTLSHFSTSTCHGGATIDTAAASPCGSYSFEIKDAIRRSFLPEDLPRNVSVDLVRDLTRSQSKKRYGQQSTIAEAGEEPDQTDPSLGQRGGEARTEVTDRNTWTRELTVSVFSDSCSSATGRLPYDNDEAEQDEARNPARQSRSQQHGTTGSDLTIPGKQASDTFVDHLDWDFSTVDNVRLSRVSIDGRLHVGDL